MSIPIQTDPFSVAINGVALLVALLQLYCMWARRRTRDDHEAYDLRALGPGQVRCTAAPAPS